MSVFLSFHGAWDMCEATIVICFSLTNVETSKQTSCLIKFYSDLENKNRPFVAQLNNNQLV